MDNRLFNLVGERPGELRRQQLPLVARALVALFRGQARSETGYTKNLAYVRIYSSSLSVQILGTDWAKIMPYIRDDSLNQVVVKSQNDPVWLDPVVAHEISIIDSTDREYYRKVYSVLWGLFPRSYPVA